MGMYEDRARVKMANYRAAASGTTDEKAILAPELFDRWSAESVAYAVGDRVRYGDLLYKCLTAHTSQESWSPDASPSLWVRIDDPAIEWPEWRQPQGSTDAYAKGAKVSHNGKHWISDLDANVWEPGVSGWTEYTEV